jgi:hypothetical protein
MLNKPMRKGNKGENYLIRFPVQIYQMLEHLEGVQTYLRKVNSFFFFFPKFVKLIVIQQN